LAAYKEHAMLEQHINNNEMKELTYTKFPPIDYNAPKVFPLLSPAAVRRQYVVDGGADPDALPAILQNSLGKLEMDFLRQNYQQHHQTMGKNGQQQLKIAHEGKLALKHDDEEPEAKQNVILANGGPPTLQQQKQQQQPQQQELKKHQANGVQQHQPNGVLKVAMYGEFPISAAVQNNEQ